MDLLTHLFLPLTVVYVVFREKFRSPWYLLIGGFGAVADVDKFLGMQGLTHSLVTLVPICLAVLGAEYALRDRLDLSPLIVGVILSHLVLDFVDGGPVPLLFPFVESGIGLTYPAKLAFGTGPLGIAPTVEGSVTAIRTTVPSQGYGTFGFLQPAGIASFLAFLSVYVGLWFDESRDAASQE